MRPPLGSNFIGEAFLRARREEQRRLPRDAIVLSNGGNYLGASLLGTFRARGVALIGRTPVAVARKAKRVVAGTSIGGSEFELLVANSARPPLISVCTESPRTNRGGPLRCRCTGRTAPR